MLCVCGHKSPCPGPLLESMFLKVVYKEGFIVREDGRSIDIVEEGEAATEIQAAVGIGGFRRER